MFIKLNQRGFTLVEIMIVVAIIGLLAAIAIPNLLRARLNANEGAVKADMKTLSSAAESFRGAQAPASYPAAMAGLTGATPPYLDVTWNSLQKHGYVFAYVAGAVVNGTIQQYTATAIPTTVDVTGIHDFCVDHTGVVRQSPRATGAAGMVAGGACVAAAANAVNAVGSAIE